MKNTSKLDKATKLFLLNICLRLNEKLGITRWFI